MTITILFFLFIVEAMAAQTCCPNPCVAQPDQNPWSMRIPDSGFGQIVEQNGQGFSDVYLTSPKGTSSIGARLNWGGSIIFFGFTNANTSNVIDGTEIGHQLRISLFDPARSYQPCACNATCDESQPCSNSASYTGWDPVLGMDKCNNTAKVLSYQRVGDALQIVSQPLQWNPDWNRCDCMQSVCNSSPVNADIQFVFELRFINETVIEVMTELKSLENIDHPSTIQEFPCLYVSHGDAGCIDLPILLDSLGNQIDISTPSSNGYIGTFTSKNSWVSFQDKTWKWGVGYLSDQGITDWLGARGTNPYYHFVRPTIKFGINRGSMIRGLSYLALGSYKQIQTSLERVRTIRPPFGAVENPSYSSSPIPVLVGSPLVVSGWVADNSPVVSVNLEIDGAFVMSLPINVNRTDICQQFPDYGACPTIGFDGAVDTTTWSSCLHLLTVIAVDQDGNKSTLAERVFSAS